MEHNTQIICEYCEQFTNINPKNQHYDNKAWLPGQQNTLNKMIIFLNMELLIPTECVRINCDQ